MFDLCLHAWKQDIPALTSVQCIKPMLWLLLTLALLEVRMQWRVLYWQLTRYLIIISQTITGLIVIGEILEHREEKCQVYWQGISILWRVFLLLHLSSPLLILVASQTAQTLTPRWGILPKRQTHCCISSPLGRAYLWPFSKGKKRKGSERPLKGQCEWQGLLSIRIVFCKKRSGSKLWDW